MMRPSPPFSAGLGDWSTRHPGGPVVRGNHRRRTLRQVLGQPTDEAGDDPRLNLTTVEDTTDDEIQ